MSLKFLNYRITSSPTMEKKKSVTRHSDSSAYVVTGGQKRIIQSFRLQRLMYSLSKLLKFWRKISGRSTIFEGFFGRTSIPFYRFITVVDLKRCIYSKFSSRNARGSGPHFYVINPTFHAGYCFFEFTNKS